MFQGTLIMESLAVGTALDTRIMCRKIRRIQPTGTTQDQSRTWTLIDFEVAANDAKSLAHALADALDQPGWYADFRSDTETWVIFPDRTFTYRRGDAAARAAAVEHARQLNIPETQLDWPI